MALMPSSGTCLLRWALELSPRVSPWGFASSGLECWYHKLWHAKPLKGRNLAANEALFTSQKAPRPAESQRFKVPEAVILGMCNVQGIDGAHGLQPCQSNCDCPCCTWQELCFPKPESKAAFGILLFSYISALVFEVTIPMHFLSGFLQALKLFFHSVFFLIQKAACFGKVSLGLHCTHLFAMNEKHFSFLLNYCCQIPCVHMFLAIL